MPKGLERRYGHGHLHFITFSCYRRLPLLKSSRARNLFVEILGQIRARYRFSLVGYVAMPEHVHLLVGEPRVGTPSIVMQVLKQRVSRELRRVRFDASGMELVRFWQPRFYDFNVWSWEKRIEKLRYMHRNPVARGLVEKPEDWIWSSYCFYARTGSVLISLDVVE